MKNDTGIVTNNPLNFVPPQNESNIFHMTFQDLVNKICSRSSKYIHVRSMTEHITGMIKSHTKMLELIRTNQQGKSVRSCLVKDCV